MKLLLGLVALFLGTVAAEHVEGVFDKASPLVGDAPLSSVTAGFDCGMRKLALQYAVHIQPGISKEALQDIADALNGTPEAMCRNVTVADAYIGAAHAGPGAQLQRPARQLPARSSELVDVVLLIDAAYHR